MKVPLLSRCFITNPPVTYGKVASSTVGSAAAIPIDCETGSELKQRSRNRNLLLRLRKKIFKSNDDYTMVARQALGLERAQSLESKTDCDESVVTTASVDIDCKGLRHQAASTQSLPPVSNNSTRYISQKERDNASLPTKSSLRRRSSSDSVSSAMDESCSGHSILDELLMEVYKDPYEEFLHRVNSSKKIGGKLEEIEVDILTQLPAIKMNVSPKRGLQKRTRRITINNSGSSTRALQSLRSNFDQYSDAGPEGRDPDDEGTQQKSFDINPYLTDRSNTKEIIISRSKLSSPSSVPKRSELNIDADSSLVKMEHQNVCGHDDRMKRTSARKVPRQRRATVDTSSSVGSYHGRVEV